MKINEFDNRAREWDKETIHWERSKAIAERMIAKIPFKPTMKALEFGAAIVDYFSEPPKGERILQKMQV